MIKIDQKAISRKENITVRFLFENSKDKFKLTLISDDSGFDRKIVDQNLHRPGLALAGFVDLFSYTRVQVFGNTEMQYLSKLDSAKRIEALTKFFQFDIPCIIVTDSNTPFQEMVYLANQFNIPLFTSPFSTTKLAYLVSDFLDDQFAPRVSLHGSFVDVYGVGMMFMGKSGIGKSEVALDLVERGHRLVADDVIILTKKGEGILMGTGTNIARHYMEIRGLGLINVAKIFGIRAIRYQKRVEIVIELEVWDKNTEYTRTGLDEQMCSILNVDLPHIKLPILPGKNITVIAEVISLNYLLKYYGYNASQVFQERLNDLLLKKKTNDIRGVDYFEHDFE